MKHKVTVVTLCSGYDSQMLACRRLEREDPELEFDLIAWAEIDKYAIKAHNALFPEYADRNMGDITTADWSQLYKNQNIPEEGVDLMFISSPCQSISTAGKGAGLKKGSGTVSSLLWETERAIRELKPKIIIGENVKGLISKVHFPVYQEWLKLLESYGYRNYLQVLNAKDFGVPQHRERVFTVSIRDSDEPFVFPSPIPLGEIRAKHRLQSFREVPEKFYLAQDKVNEIISAVEQKGNRDILEMATVIVEEDDEGNDVKIMSCAIRGKGEGDDYAQRLEPGDEIANCITTVQKDSLILEKHTPRKPRKKDER